MLKVSHALLFLGGALSGRLINPHLHVRQQATHSGSIRPARGLQEGQQQSEEDQRGLCARRAAKGFVSGGRSRAIFGETTPHGRLVLEGKG